jgi:hypothetical protein
MAPMFRVEAEIHGTASIEVEANDEESAQEIGMELIEQGDSEAEIMDDTLWLNTGVHELDD